jgi:hypothetical protein
VRVALFSAKVTEQLEQQYCIKFCQNLGDSQVKTIWKIQWVFSDLAMGITQIKEWYNFFKDGRMSVESDACSGRPSTSQNDELIDQVRTLAMQDRRITVRELAEEVGISTGSVHFILTDDLNMRIKWQLHHDNAPAQSSHLIQNFLTKHNIPVIRQAPYSPDMAVCDFWLFPHLKTQLKGTRFESRDDIVRNTTAKLYPFAKRHFRISSNNVGTAGRSVFTHKETTSKGIRVADLQTCKCIFPGQSRIIF